jgi:hypothetical protein
VTQRQAFTREPAGLQVDLRAYMQRHAYLWRMASSNTVILS